MVPIFYAIEYFSSEQKISLLIIQIFFFFFCLLVYLNNNPLTLAVSGKMRQGFFFFIEFLLHDISRVPDLLMHSLIKN